MTENGNNPDGQEPVWEEDQGWRVLDADGNVVASGPGIKMEMSAGIGEMFQAMGLMEKEQ